MLAFGGRGTREMLEPSLADLPHVSAALIHRMLDDMAVLVVIERPLRMTG
jgi:hypothetical protein